MVSRDVIPLIDEVVGNVGGVTVADINGKTAGGIVINVREVN